MKLKKTAGYILFAAFMLLLSGCAKKEEEKPIQVAIYDDVVSLDMAATKDVFSETVGRCIFSTLYTFDEDMNMVPLLAEKEEQISELEWLFTIRKDAFFHDGTPIKASDAAFSIRRAMENELSAGNLDIIDTIDAVDDYTIKVVTKEPAMNLPTMFVRINTSIMSEKAVSDPDYDFNHPVGSGAFKVVERKEEKEICLERFDQYFNGAAKSKYLNFVVVPIESDAISNMLNGTIDVIYKVSANDADYMKLNDDIHIYEADSPKLELLMLNSRVEPIDNILVRKAIAHAVNKKRLVEHVLAGYGKVTNSLIPAPLAGHREFADYEYNPEKAKELLAEAGYPDGLDLTVLAFDEQRKKLLEYLRLDFAESNIRLHYELLPLDDYLKAVTEGKQEASATGWTSNPDPDSMLTQLYSKSGHPTANHGQYTNPEAEELLVQGRMETDPKKRDEIYGKINEIIMSDYAAVPLYQASALVAAREDIEGVQINAQGIFGYETLSRKTK